MAVDSTHLFQHRPNGIKEAQMTRIGLVGYGFMGKMHAECYSASGKGTIVSIADVEADRRQEASATLGCPAERRQRRTS